MLGVCGWQEARHVWGLQQEGRVTVASYFLQFMLFAFFGCILQENVGLLCWHNQHIGTECNALNEEKITRNTTMI